MPARKDSRSAGGSRRTAFRTDSTSRHLSKVSSERAVGYAFFQAHQVAATPAAPRYTSTVNAISVRCTGLYNVSRSSGSLPASRINLSNSPRRSDCEVVAPASW